MLGQMPSYFSTETAGTLSVGSLSSLDYPILELQLLGLFRLGLCPVGTLSCFASQTAGTLSVGSLLSFCSDFFNYPVIVDVTDKVREET